MWYILFFNMRVLNISLFSCLLHDFFVSCLWNAEEKDILRSKSSCLSLQQEMRALGDSWGLISLVSLSNRRIYFLQNYNVDFSHSDRLLVGVFVAGPCSQLTPAGHSGMMETERQGQGHGQGLGARHSWGCSWQVSLQMLFGIPMVSKHSSWPRDGRPRGHPLWEGAASQGLTTGVLGTAE